MTTNIAIRLQATGGAEVKREFDEAGAAGRTAFDGVTSALDRTSAGADKVVSKVREAAEAARVAQTTANTAGSPVSGAGSSQTGGSPATAAQISRIRSQLDEDYRREQQADRANRLIGQGEASGQFTPSYADRLRTLSDRKYGPQNDNQKEGLSTYDRLFVKYQAIDSAQQLYSGASPSVVALQQGGQVFQQLADREGGLKSGLSQLAESAKGLVTPFTVAGAAVVAATAVFALAASSYQRDQATLTRSLTTTGRSTDLSVAQLDALASRTAEAGKVSTSTAREIAAGFASTGEIAAPVFDALISKTSDYAKIIGSDVPTATADLARMFADPARGAEELGNKLGGIDDKTRQYITTLAEQGDKTAAQTALAEALKGQIDANAESTTRWGQAWNFVSATADQAWESIKRAAGASVTTPQSVLADLNLRVAEAEKRQASSAFLDPLRAQRDAVQAEADKAERATKARAEEEARVKNSVAAGAVARSIDPNLAQLTDVDKKLATLRDGLSDPLTRAKIDPTTLEAADRGYDALFRARTTLVDINGKLISSEERVRQQDQLTLDAKNAKTDAEKAAVAVRQKEFDLAGKVVTTRSAAEQSAMAGVISSAGSDSKGDGKSGADKRDDFDSAERNIQNSIRRQNEQNETYGMGAEAVARYRTQTELLTAAKRAEREVTPELSAKIEEYANQASEAAKRNEELRESSKRTDEYRSIGSDGVRTFVRGLSDGVAQGKLLENVMSNLKSRIADLASNSISDMLFGKRGGSDAGFLSSLFSGGSSAANAPIAGAQG
ncbi:hypothetical protein G3T14_23485, partial [Methylobacterium sp. BTF04]|uniref:phage tail length tape measure family protein n=1 Tax=Methylobacterium sp. BTF04 TaxID=2708300 RepID=UPI0014019BA6